MKHEDDPDRSGATGLKVDRRGRLFVSGADSKHIRVYDARTGDELAGYFALGGDHVNGAGFNANGIEAARGGKSLIVVRSNTGELDVVKVPKR